MPEAGVSAPPFPKINITAKERWLMMEWWSGVMQKELHDSVRDTFKIR